MKLAFVTMTFVLCVSMLLWPQDEAAGVPQFRNQFRSQYTDQGNPRDPWTRKVVTANCTICHADDKNKKVMNLYGSRLGRYLNKEDKLKTQKINDSLDAVYRERVDPNDPESPTFGDYIRNQFLPGEAEQ